MLIELRLLLYSLFDKFSGLIIQQTISNEHKINNKISTKILFRKEGV